MAWETIPSASITQNTPAPATLVEWRRRAHTFEALEPFTAEAIEAVFRALKSDLSLRPIFHQLEHRVDAHIFVAFLAYCLMVTLQKRLQAHAPGLTPRSALEKLGTIQMLESAVLTLASPKSATFTSPFSVSMMLSGLMSR